MKKTDGSFTPPVPPVAVNGKASRSPAKASGKRRLVVKKWGNSAGVRIPMEMMTAAHLKIDQEVDAHIEGEDLILTPVRKDGYTLQGLLDAITSDNLHAPVDTGAAQGAEVW